MEITRLILFGAGIFSIVCAVANFDWFMNSRRARFFVGLFGHDGARVFYVILGVVIIILSFLVK